MNGTQTQRLVNPLFNMTAEQINAYCEDRGSRFAKSVSTSQLRNIYSKIVSIRTFYNNPGKKDQRNFFEKIKRDITLLKPRLAYAAGRDNELRAFHREMVELINITVNSIDLELSQKRNEDFKLDSIDNFFTIVEGFVAYHKFYGGK